MKSKMRHHQIIILPLNKSVSPEVSRGKLNPRPLLVNEIILIDNLVELSPRNNRVHLRDYRHIRRINKG